MIKEEYVKYKTALLLKDAGFPQESQMYYDADFGKLCQWSDAKIAAPTQSLAMRWLRENKGIFIDIENRYGKGTAHWDFKLVDVDDMDNILEFAKSLEYTYESAAEAGIQAACKYIISNGQ